MLSLDGPQCDSGDDVFAEREVDHKQRQDGERQPEVNGTVFHLVDIPLQLGYHHRHCIEVIPGEQDRRHEQLVPGADKAEDRLGRHRRLHDRQGDLIKGLELA